MTTQLHFVYAAPNLGLVNVALRSIGARAWEVRISLNGTREQVRQFVTFQSAVRWAEKEQERMLERDHGFPFDIAG